jgi:hypothetical protein
VKSYRQTDGWVGKGFRQILKMLCFREHSLKSLLIGDFACFAAEGAIPFFLLHSPHSITFINAIADISL